MGISVWQLLGLMLICCLTQLQPQPRCSAAEKAKAENGIISVNNCGLCHLGTRSNSWRGHQGWGGTAKGSSALTPGRFSPLAPGFQVWPGGSNYSE